MIKFAVDQALVNMTPTDDDIADCIETVMKNFRIRDQFQLNKVVPQLEEIGVESIVIRQEGIEIFRFGYVTVFIIQDFQL